MNRDEQAELFERGVSTFIDPDGVFKDKLERKAKGEYKKDIVIKFGVDPTRPDIHLGHAVVLRRLRQFQDLGCKVVFLVGDYTAQIGDPTGESKIRPELTITEIQKNMKTYLEQVGKILRDDPAVFSWITNSDWFLNVTDVSANVDAKLELEGKKIEPNSFIGKALLFENTRMQRKIGPDKGIIGITLRGLLWTLKHITHQRLIERDMFQDRLKSGSELYMHEMLYPVLQGIDSFALSHIYGSCDLEMGGADQTFNMLMGRDVMKANGVEQQAVLAMKIIPGTDGKEKMSKSLDNYIGINETPEEIFGKTMSIPDSLMKEYFLLATYTPIAEVEEMEKKLESGKLHPRDMKLRLAREITAIYHGTDAAKKAEEGFIDTFSRGGVPKEIVVVKVASGSKLGDVLLSQGLVDSKSEFQRLLKEGAIKNIDTDSSLDESHVSLEDNITLRIGKHRFIKIEIV
jgi:tyrosyl-tRNA synthetase